MNSVVPLMMMILCNWALETVRLVRTRLVDLALQSPDLLRWKHGSLRDITTVKKKMTRDMIRRSR